MSLLRPKNMRNRQRRRLPEKVTNECILNGHQISWCMGLCTPIAGHGMCGRLAPHAMKGKTQLAIAAFKARRKAEQR